MIELASPNMLARVGGRLAGDVLPLPDGPVLLNVFLSLSLTVLPTSPPEKSSPSILF